MATYSTKIVRLDAKDKCLDFTDNLEYRYKVKGDKVDTLMLEGKVTLNYCNYGVSPSVNLRHNLEVGAARTLCEDVLNYRFRAQKDRAGNIVKDSNGNTKYVPLVDEWKGGKGTSFGHKDWDICSTHLTVTYAPSQKNPSYGVIVFTIEHCEGVELDKRTVKPKNGAPKTRESIIVPLDMLDRDGNYQAPGQIRSKFASLLAFLDAKLTTSRFMFNVHKADAERKASYANAADDQEESTYTPE